MKMQGQRLVEAESRSKQGVVAVDGGRTPVVRKGCVQALGFFRINAPEGLAGHPVEQIVSGPLLTRRGGELPGIVGHSELIQAGISLSGLYVVKGSYRRRLLAGSEPKFPNADRVAMELGNQPGRVVRKGYGISSENH